MAKIGLIGTGTMGEVVLRAVVALEQYKNEYYCANRTMAKAKQLAEQLEGIACDNITLAKECDWIFLGVKPQMMEEVLLEIAPALQQREEKVVLVSMAAGVTLERLRELLGFDCAVIRMMPNTPMEVGYGTVQYCGHCVDEQTLATFGRWMSSHHGIADEIPESLMDAATAVSGCGPAFCAMMLEAMADAGVQCGLPRDKAYSYAAQTMLGTAKLVLDQGKHPASIKDSVCSPAGATIEGVAALEENGFRGATMSGVKAAYDRMNLLGKHTME